MSEGKTCTRCCRFLAPDQFFLNKSAAGTAYRHSRCKDCRREQNRLASKTPQGRRVKRRGVLTRACGVSEQRFEQMLSLQGEVCAICGRPETKRHRDGSTLRLSVDHDHATRVVRGLLCQQCNVGLGSFGDDPDRLRLAAEYLERFQLGQARQQSGQSPAAQAAGS